MLYKKIRNFYRFYETYKKLKNHTFKPTRVFIVGNMMGNENIFTLSQVWPMIHHEAVDYIERTKAYPLPHRRFFKKGVSQKINNKFSSSTLTTNPYEVFNIDEKKVKGEYKK